MNEKSHRWQRTAIAAAAIALSGLSASPVLALSLGRITVQSALGEPLRAEIDVPSISADEASSLKANVASPAAFTAAGLEYNPAMSGLQAQLARRADGRSYIRLTSDRAINEPFVDMILEASWASGRIVRDYTMLFDPPSLKAQAPTPAPTLPQAPVAVPVAPAAASVAVKPAPAAEAPAAKPAAAAPAKVARSDSSNPQQVTVQAGDSASKLANRYKASDVSLDQMLVAMLRTNPDAFAKGNLNRLRAGSVLDLPSADQAKSMSAAEASQTVVAQSKDFNEFRRNLAGNAPAAAVEAPSRKATGSVDAKVDDKKPASNAPDKLTLSKGAVQAGKADEAKIAKERADKDAAARAAEIAKNIADLNKLSAASEPKAAAGPAGAATASAPAKGGMEVAVAQAPVASAPAVAAAVAATSAPAKPMGQTPVPAQEASLLDELMEDPTLPLAGGGLLALLGGFFWYKRRQNNKQAARVDSSFLESRLQPDSFFGASGGQRVDTAQGSVNGGSSSMSFTSSQLGAADDVDPVAEADVYLAYGRDAQAEEILKEAARHNPGRLAIHSKLMEVYAKRRDAANFQVSANHAFQLVGVNSPEWAHICEMGLSIDPENPLYQPGVASASAFGTLEPTTDSDSVSGDSTVPISSMAELPPASDLDLDLDFSAEEAAASAAAPLTAAGDEEKTQKLQAQPETPSNSLDFDISGPGELSATPDATSPHPELSQALPDLSMAMDGLSMKESGDTAPAPAAPVEEAPAKPNDGMLEFDLGSLSLDLEPAAAGAETAPAAVEEEESSSFDNDSLETKLALAEEFVSIGDQDGARALIEEVVAEANGPLREKAQRALAKLS